MNKLIKTVCACAVWIVYCIACAMCGVNETIVVKQHYNYHTRASLVRFYAMLYTFRALCVVLYTPSHHDIEHNIYLDAAVAGVA